MYFCDNRRCYRIDVYSGPWEGPDEGLTRRFLGCWGYRTEYCLVDDVVQPVRIVDDVDEVLNCAQGVVDDHTSYYIEHVLCYCDRR